MTRDGEAARGRDVAWRLLAGLLCLCAAAVQGAYLNVDTNGNVKVPTNFPKFLLLSGNNFTAEPTNTPDGWAIRGHATGGGGAGATNWSAGNTTATRIAIVSLGTNNTGAIKTLSVSGSATLTEEGDTNVIIGTGAGSGEANVNGEVAVTNAAVMGLVFGKAGITNLLRSLQGGNFVILTNQGTNIIVAVDVTLTNGLATIAFVYAIGANDTNYVNSRAVNLTNAVNSFSVALSNLCYTIGANGTNFAYSIGANDTNYVNSRAVNLTNAVNSFSVACSNLAYAVGANGTNFAYSIGANGTNYVNSRAVNLTNALNSISVALSNLCYTIGANGTNYAQPVDSDLTALANLAGVDGDVIVRSNSAWARLPKGSSGQVVKMDATGTYPEWGTDLGGSGSPGGTEAMLQFNDAGAFAGATNALWDETNRTLKVDNLNVHTNLNAPFLILSNAFVLPGMSNVIWVTPWADDTRALRGRMDRPFSLTNGVNSASSGDSILVMAGNYTNLLFEDWTDGDYRGQLHIQSKDNIRITGIGEVNIWSPTGGNAVVLWYADAITLEGLNFRSVKTDALYNGGGGGGVSNYVNSAGEPFGAIGMQHCSYITIRNCGFYNLWGWGAKQLELGVSWACTNGILIEGCYATNCGISTTTYPAQGGAFHVAPGAVIRDCTIERCMNGIWWYIPTSTTGWLPSPIVERCRFVDCNDNGITSTALRWARGPSFRLNHFQRQTNYGFSIPYMRTNLVSTHIFVGPWDDEVVEQNRFIGAARGWELQNDATCCNQTNLLIRFNIFADCRQVAIGIGNFNNNTNYNTRIVNNSMQRMFDYGILWSGRNVDTDIRENTVFGFDTRGLGNYAIGFKLCPFGSNVVVEDNTLLGNAGTSIDALHIGTNTWNMRLGFNPIYNTTGGYITGSNAGVRLTMMSYLDDTNILDTYDNLQFITPSRQAVNFWFTNVLVGSNWLRSALSNWNYLGLSSNLVLSVVSNQVSAPNTNLTIDLNLASMRFNLMTNVFFSNTVNRANLKMKSTTVFIYPTNRVSTLFYNANWKTNLNNPLLPAVTNGTIGVLSLTCNGDQETNVFASYTVWK